MTISGYYDHLYVKNISDKIAKLCSEFNQQEFIAQMQAQLLGKTYTEKITIIANGIYNQILNYGKALEIFTQMLGAKLTSMSQMYAEGMFYAPFGKFVEIYATQNEDCFDQTVEYVYQLTQRYTGEFAMRPLLREFPQKTIAVIKKWSTDSSDCVRRLCSECMRVALPWSSKLNFALEYFGEYCQILIKLANDKCEYVRRSVANNINELFKVDIVKARFVVGEISKIGDDKNIKKLITHATRWARKNNIV